MTTPTLEVARQSKAQKIYADDPDAMKFYEMRQDAMCLQVADLVPNRDELWLVEKIERKGGGAFWQVTLQSPRGTQYHFDPRWETLGKHEGDPGLRNLRFYRPRPGF